MSNKFTDWIRDVDVGELLEVFFDGDYYEILFPFLIVFAVLYTALGKVNIFKYKKGDNEGKPIKSVLAIVSLVVSFYAVNFEISEGYTLGNFMMMMFPNISALTIGILALYITGSMFGKDFFSGLFDKTYSSYLFMAAGIIGLGSIVFYGGIVMGFWNHLEINNLNTWNMILTVAFLIMGVVFLFIDLIPFGLVLLFVVASYILNDGFVDSGSGSVLSVFLDPVVFIMAIMALLFTWMNSDNLDYQRKKLDKMEKNFQKSYGGKTFKPYENRIYDISEPSLKKQRDLVRKLEKR